jgi:penicillin-binding protein 1C
MREVSGVTGAAPVMHDLIEHLHAGLNRSWYRQPDTLKEWTVNSFTGKRIPPSENTRSKQPTEWLPLNRLPPMQSPADHLDGRIVLGAEYARWLASPDNYAPSRLTLKHSAQSAARLLFPLPGTVLVMDPDLPESSSILNLRLNIPSNVQWSSQTLECFVEDGHSRARLQPGRHEITASVDGRRLTTWVEVRAR